MDPEFHTTNSHGSRAHRVAWGAIAAVALAQGGAVAVAWKDHAAVAKAEAGPEVEVEAPKAAPVEPDPFASDAVAWDDPHPELLQPAGAPPNVPDPAEPVLARPAVVPPAPLDVPIRDAVCLAHLDEGIYLRDRGDMSGAVAELRQALELAPEHPKLLFQLARSLDEMSQERKAAEHWRKLRLLGQDAGNYYLLAVERLKEGGSLPPPPDTVFEAQEVKQGRFVVSNVKVEHLPESAQGEAWVISGRIDRKQAEPAIVGNIAVKLHLFDEVNGQRIDRFSGAQPPHSWPDAPTDWADGSERFEFICHRPPLSPDELVRLGQRKYYGYALEIRYGAHAEDFKRNELQDLVAEPAMLAEMSQEMPEWTPPADAGLMLDGPMDGFMDLRGPGGAPDQPDAVLFPGDKLD